MPYLDKTFCCSPNCLNKCGKKMTSDEKDAMPSNITIWYAFFCGGSPNKFMDGYTDGLILKTRKGKF